MSQIAVGSGQYSDGERLQSFDAAAPAGRFNLFRARRPVLFAYSVPLITVGSALVITLISFYFVGYRPNPVIALAYPLAVLAAAWWGGYGPGILSAALCFVVVPYLLLPNFSITKVDPTRGRGSSAIPRWQETGGEGRG